MQTSIIDLSDSNRCHKRKWDFSQQASAAKRTKMEDEEVVLFVKAGDDGKSYGACPFCQQLFMLLLLKSEQLKCLTFQVATVHPARPPELFRKLSLRRVPALLHGDCALDTPDDIVCHLDRAFPTPSVATHDPEADDRIRDVFQRFCFFLRDVAKQPANLLAELARIDDLLAKRHVTFISADHLTQLDCELLPKLHHIRVACKALKSLDFPYHLRHLWAYLARAYGEEAFWKACPSDQEIIAHWSERPDMPRLSLEQRARLARETPRYSFDTPYDLQDSSNRMNCLHITEQT